MDGVCSSRSQMELLIHYHGSFMGVHGVSSMFYCDCLSVLVLTGGPEWSEVIVAISTLRRNIPIASSGVFSISHSCLR